MKRVKRTVFAGAVCEQIVFNVADNVRNLKKAQPKPRFRNEEERARHRTEIARRHHAQKFNEAFRAGSSLYSTLTFNDEWEVHTFGEAEKIKSAYIRRLQRRYPNAKIAFYKGRGRGTKRIHFHMVSEGIPEEIIREQWKYGQIVGVEELHGTNKYEEVPGALDFTGLANYLFNHWTEEQGGHRYFMTRNIKAPKKERVTLIMRDYTIDKPPRAPKGYKLVERAKNEFGYLYYKYVRIPEKRRRGERIPPPLKRSPSREVWEAEKKEKRR